MISGITIKQMIDSGELFQLPTGEEREKVKARVQSASIDLTAKYFYIASQNRNISISTDLDKFAFDSHHLQPGETVIIKIAEKFNMPKQVAGTVFPPNSLSSKGLIMTNPGHIDPGFKGYISVCLVNMGRNVVILDGKHKVATLILSALDHETEGYEGSESVGVSKQQISNIGNDFAGLDERIPKIVNKSVGKSAFVALAFVAVVMTLIAIIAPEITQYRTERKDIALISKDLILPLQKEVFILKKQLQSSEANLKSMREQNSLELAKLRQELANMSTFPDKSSGDSLAISNK
ncbi:MAG: hypothetical protein KJ856_13415 [Gammaproteobacteria bacterium]|nr:hypothetical protein [Gammaproteobacteria bacterium]MBU1476985.1 hypothetical protein [Gammaproteobacteria bacterium]MBU2003553.1 hypothetical protein [Gammaproteobacteria bacterium]MBU2133072.1 hypothetical protein [Gammaproteobacteria bacterium]MBU2187989.1 hypothetical protein [Gammaproteobacteria bacterium]